MVKIGSPAPNFHLEGFSKGHFKKYELKDFKGKWLVVFFYPLDFTFVCPTEIREFSARYPEFKKLNAEVLGVSVDSVHSHEAWVEGSLGAINFPLLSDFHKKMARDYEVLLEDEGVALRATLLIDPYGKVQYALLCNNDVGRSVAETLRVLAAFQTGKLCPAEWKPGQKTL